MYSRNIAGSVLTLEPSGWTYDSTFVLFDLETESLWFPKGDHLLCIEGAYFKRKLTELPYRDTTWKEWLRSHPESKIAY